MSGIFSDKDAAAIKQSVRSDGFWQFFKRQIQIQYDLFNRKLHVCEIGAGTGANAILARREIPELFIIYTAIDGSQEVLNELEKEKLKHVTTQCGDFDAQRILPVADIYLSKFVFHHVKQKKELLAEMYEKLPQNGSVLIIDKFPRIVLATYFFEWLLDILRIKSRLGVHYYTKYPKFKRYIKSIGFDIEEEIIKKPSRLTNFFVYKVFLVLRKR